MKRFRNFSLWQKKYGPGFIAVSKKTGRVLAAGRDIKKLWESAKRKYVNFSSIVITHVPKYGVVNVYFRASSKIT